MKRFLYVSADTGVSLPGTKGSSVHVAGVVAALTRAGLVGEVRSARARATTLRGVPLSPLAPDDGGKRGELEAYLLGRDSLRDVEPRPDFVYERYSLWHTGGLARAREWGVPFVLEVNSPLPREARRYRALRHHPLASGIADLLMKQADGVVCVSEQVADWVRGMRETTRGVWVVPNGVDPELFAPPATRRGPSNGDPTVVFCGSFRPWHGLEDLLGAFRILVERHVSAARLLCVGDGPLREGFAEDARRLGLDTRIRFTGSVPQAEVPRWLSRGDLAVAPYQDLEDFYYSPLKVFEFMALGLPLVAADIGQIRAVLDDGRLGSLYRPGDAADLARVMAHALTDGREDAVRRARAASTWVAQHATWDRRVRQILDGIETLVERVTA